MKHLLLLSMTGLTLSGCAWLGNSADDPRIGGLKYEPVTIEKRPIDATDKQEIIQNYDALLRLNPDQRLGSEATRRLADLELALSEDKLLDQPQLGVLDVVVERNGLGRPRVGQRLVVLDRGGRPIGILSLVDPIE